MGHEMSIFELANEVKTLLASQESVAQRTKPLKKADILKQSILYTQWCLFNNREPTDFTSGLHHIYSQLYSLSKNKKGGINENFKAKRKEKQVIKKENRFGESGTSVRQDEKGV